jgi:ABC-type multidrug transport system ATPase subunit/ABC-type multidrug transport system permease subunit
MSSPSPSVEVRDLTVSFGSFKAVDSVSFEVRPGEIFGFLGANGAGKTTTIRVLCGLLRPTSGEVRVGGLDLKDGLPAVKARVGYMSQRFTLYQDLTVFENLEFTAALRKIPTDVFRSRLDEILGFIGFQRDLTTLVKDLPGGQKQEVSLAAAILPDPAVIFLDEPTAGVTPAARARFWALIRSLSGQGKTVFVTTHYMDEAEQCGRIALMRAGRVIALDTPEGLKRSASQSRWWSSPSRPTDPTLSPTKRKRRCWDACGPKGNCRRSSPTVCATTPSSGIPRPGPIASATRAPRSRHGPSNPPWRTSSSGSSKGKRHERPSSNGGGFVLARAKSIALKEVRHILRDPFTLGLAWAFPPDGLVLRPRHGLHRPRHRVTVYDRDQTASSRPPMGDHQRFRIFHVTRGDPSEPPQKSVDAQKAKAALVIEPGFERRLLSGKGAEIQALIDGSDNSTAGVIGGYLGGIQRAAIPRLTGQAPSETASLQTRYLFNGELNSRWFSVPGLSVVVLAIISIMLTALTIAREWENGSMEMLLSTPAHPLEIIVGKLSPYVVLGLTAQALIYVAARWYFGVPFLGSHGVFLLGALLFLSAYMALGLVISVATRVQALALQLALLVGMLPSLLLSGFIFPIENMPAFFQAFTCVLPARWYTTIIRGVFLQGATFAELAIPFAPSSS